MKARDQRVLERAAAAARGRVDEARQPVLRQHVLQGDEGASAEARPAPPASAAAGSSGSRRSVAGSAGSAALRHARAATASRGPMPGVAARGARACRAARDPRPGQPPFGPRKRQDTRRPRAGRTQVVMSPVSHRPQRPSVGEALRAAARRLARARVFFGHGTDNALDDAAVLLWHAMAFDFDVPRRTRLPQAHDRRAGRGVPGAARAAHRVARAGGLPHRHHAVRRHPDPDRPAGPGAALAARRADRAALRALDRPGPRAPRARPRHRLGLHRDRLRALPAARAGRRDRRLAGRAGAGARERAPRCASAGACACASRIISQRWASAATISS